MKKLGMVFSFFGLVALFIGCGGGKAGVAPSSLPKWALTPPGACEVGISKIRNQNLGPAKTAAEARGRAALAQALNTRVQNMIKDYQQSGETDGKSFAEELTTSVTRNLVDQRLVGTKARDAHIAEGDNAQYFALMCIDTEAFGSVFDQMKSLGQKQREALKARAKVEFDDLDRQIEKNKR